MRRLCSIQGCDHPHRARGWCDAHYRRWRQFGDPTSGKPVPPWHDISGDPADPRHGTMNGYQNLLCRCSRCTEAWAVWHREHMAADPCRLARHALYERMRRSARRKASQ